MSIKLSRRSFLKGLSTVTFLTFQKINVSSTFEALGEILDIEPLIFNVHRKQLEIANYLIHLIVMMLMELTKVI